MALKPIKVETVSGNRVLGTKVVNLWVANMVEVLAEVCYFVKEAYYRGHWYPVEGNRIVVEA